MTQPVDISHQRAIRIELDRYLAAGWHVFPVYEANPDGRCACNVDCGSPGKHPRLKPGYQPSSDERVVREWWKKYPTANIGLYPGRSGLCVLDVDPRNGGDESLVALERRIGELPETVQACTGGGGYHYFFLRPAERESMPSRVLAPGLEFKGDAGYVILPPSAHYSGKEYGWESGHHPDETKIAILPQSLLALVSDQKKSQPLPSDPDGPMAGLIGRAFACAGMMGRQVGRDRAIVTCPWQNEHTTGRPDDTSTIVFAPTLGHRLGWFHCSHAHCDKQRTVEDVLSSLPQSAVEESRKALGIDGDYAGKLPNREEPALEPTQEPQWKRSLTFSSKTLQLRPEAGNVALILANHEDWKDALVYDRFLDEITWKRVPPAIQGLQIPAIGDPFRDHHVTYVGHWFSLERGVTVASGNVRDGIQQASQKSSVDSLADWLTKLEWDRDPRVDDWLEKYLGVPAGKHVSFIGRSWLISGIARALDPGCQVDHMLVLEGPQGNGKTSALEILAGPDKLLRNIPDLSNPDARRALAGKWIVSFEELDALRRSEWSAIRAFITDRQDTVRKPYGREHVTLPRRCVFAGSTNPQKGVGYLTDPTGARRFWPVKCTDIDLEGLRQVREQLWAEARELYRHGREWHPKEKDIVNRLASEQRKRGAEPDPWEETLGELLDREPDRRWLAGDLHSALNVPIERRDMRTNMRIAKALRDHGYDKEHTRKGEVWARTVPAEPEPAEEDPFAEYLP